MVPIVRRLPRISGARIGRAISEPPRRARLALVIGVVGAVAEIAVARAREAVRIIAGGRRSGACERRGARHEHNQHRQFCIAHRIASFSGKTVPYRENAGLLKMVPATLRSSLAPENSTGF